MIDVEILPVDDADLDEVLDRWALRASTLELVYGLLVQDFHRMEARTFAELGPGWDDLADSTMQDRAYAGLDDVPMMQRSFRLIDSLIGSGNPRDPRSVDEEPSGGGPVYRVEPEGFFVGTDVSYAHWHQTGGTEGGQPPQRKIVNFTEVDRMRWYAIIGRYLAHGAGGSITASSDMGPG